MKFIFLFLVFCVSGNSIANEGAGERIGKKVDKTVDNVSEYSKEKKETFQKEFKEQLAALDTEINEIKTKANKLKETASEESTRQINDQIEFLEKQKANLKSDFKRLQSSSGRAWDQIKNGVQDSLGTLKESFRKAKQEFQSEEQN